MTPALLLLVLAQTPMFPPPPSEQQWAESACQHDGDRVTCGALSFKALTDAIIDAQADAEKCGVRLLACETTRDAYKASLLTPPVQPKPKLLFAKPLVSIIAAVIGAVALTTAITLDELDPSVRIGIGVVVSAAIAAGFTLVFF